MSLLRRCGRVKPDRVDLVQVPVGSDRGVAFVLAGRCEAKGILAVLTMDQNGVSPELAFTLENRLLVRGADLKRVQRLVDKSR